LYSDLNQQTRQTGLYVQDQIKFHEKYVLQLGGRYDWLNDDQFDPIGGVDNEQKDSAFTGRVGFVYLADNGLAPYASYSESFTPVFGRPAPGDAPFVPETGQQYEIGVKYQPPGSNAFVTLAAFDLTKQNVLSNNGIFDDQTGEQRSRGIELEGVASLTSNLDIKATYTHLDLEITENNGNNEGNTPDGQPRQRATLWADYTIRGGQLAGLGFGGGVRYTGETFGDDANTFKVPSFTLVDASIHYERDRWRFALSAQNLFDKEYVERCYDATGCFYGAVQEVTASMRYRFD
jgi:iron complex outermembrane receptor protein